jgi:hypothetical protein
VSIYKLSIIIACASFCAAFLTVALNILNASNAKEVGETAESTFSSLEAPVGTLEFASIHEAGHVVAAKSVGFSVSGAAVFQLSKPGIGLYWKGTTKIRGRGRGMAVVKLGGYCAEYFLDQHNHFQVPSFLGIVGSRKAISRTDTITAADLGGESLTEVHYRAYRALSANASSLNRVYTQLMTKKSYP